jgi:predicted DNA-binding transcriptional regulator AlpA
MPKNIWNSLTHSAQVQEGAPTALALDPLLCRERVCAALSLGPTSVGKLVRTGHLAPPVQIRGTRRVGWRASDVSRYLDGLPPVEVRPMPGSAA